MTLPAIRRRSVVDVFSSSDLHLSRLSSSRFLSLSRSPFFSIRARIPRVDRPSTSSSLTPIDRPTPPNFIPFFPFHASRSLSLSFPLASQSSTQKPSYLRLIRFFLSHRYTCFRARIRRISPHSSSFSPTPPLCTRSLSHRSPPFRSSLDPVTSLLPCLRVLPESSPPETFFLSPLRIELRGRFDIIEWIFVKEP